MLTVSRDNISCEDITEYPANSRFLKLPLQNYLKLLTFENKNVYEELNRPQIAFFNAINSPQYRFIVAAFSRRLGKTFAANVAGQVVTLMPGSHVLIVSPNYTLSNISFELGSIRLYLSAFFRSLKSQLSLSIAFKLFCE